MYIEIFAKAVKRTRNTYTNWIYGQDIDIELGIEKMCYVDNEKEKKEKEQQLNE